MSTRSEVLKVILRVGAWSSAVSVIGFAAVVATVVWPDSTALHATLFAIGTLILSYRHRRGFTRWRRSLDAVNVYVASRFLLLTAAVLQGVVSHAATGVFLVAAGLLAITHASEPLIRNINRRASPYAANIPGLVPLNGAAYRYGLVFPLNVLGMVALYLAALAPEWSAVVPLVLAMVSTVWSLGALIDLWRRIAARLRFESTIDRHLSAFAPVFAIHWHASRGTQYQIGMWLPYLERLGLPFIIVVRTSDNFREVRRMTETHPILLRRSMDSLDAVVGPSLKGVFYFNNATRNMHMVRYPHLVHIQLNHGDSDKAPSYNPAFRMYDFNFVAGQAAVDRFARHGVSMPAGIFRIVGRPQVEEIRVAHQSIREIQEKTVLYAPTWAGFHQDSNYSSLPAAMDIITALLDRGCRVIFRPHPYSYRTPELRAACGRVKDILAADRASTGREHLFGEVAERTMTVFDCFNNADAMISDVSSVVGDFLYSEKPLAMVSTSLDATAFAEEFPMAQASYVIEANGSQVHNLDEQLHSLLETDPHAQARRALKTYYLGEIPADDYASRFVNEARLALGFGTAPDDDGFHDDGGRTSRSTI